MPPMKVSITAKFKADKNVEKSTPTSQRLAGGQKKTKHVPYCIPLS